MDNRFSVEGRIILVTGASSGIGKSISQELSLAGARVILLGRDRQRLKKTKESLEGEGHAYYDIDLNHDDSLAKVADDVPKLDGIVHAAGIIKRFPIKFMSRDSFQEILDINVISGSELTRLLLKRKKINNSGSIVFISSIGSDYASLGNTMYMASKGAVNSMVKGFALELARKKIRVNAIQPGLIVTNLTNQINQEELDIQLKNYPLGRFGNTVDIANSCIYLLSSASSWITGTTLKIDGGLTLK